MERYLGQTFVTFDGKVLESFGVRGDTTGRVHVATLQRLEIGETGGELYLQPHTVWGSSPFILLFPKSQRPLAEWLVAEIDRARAPYQTPG